MKSGHVSLVFALTSVDGNPLAQSVVVVVDDDRNRIERHAVEDAPGVHPEVDAVQCPVRGRRLPVVGRDRLELDVGLVVAVGRCDDGDADVAQVVVVRQEVAVEVEALLALRLADLLKGRRQRRARPPVVVVRLAAVSAKSELKVPALVVTRGAS